MAESIFITKGANKTQQYNEFFNQITALTQGEVNLIANLANISAALKEVFDFFWVGFYLVDETANELVLGPFQGPIACTRIKPNKGVCGTSWVKKETIIVPDVNQFPGHIACSTSSLSEIVLPIVQNNQVKMVLDVDSNQLNSFDEDDKKGLEKITTFIAQELLK